MRTMMACLVLACLLTAALVVGCDKDYVDRPTRPIVSDPCTPETVYVDCGDEDHGSRLKRK